MATEEMIKDLEQSAERLRRILERFERMKLLAMPGSLTQDHSRPRWEAPDALDKDHQERIENKWGDSWPHKGERR